jgi:hypothetical protein
LKNELKIIFNYIVKPSKQSGGVNSESHTDYSRDSRDRRYIRGYINGLVYNPARNNNNGQLNEAVGISGVVLIVIFMILQLIFGNNSESIAETIINLLNLSQTQGGRKGVKKNRKSKKQPKSKRKGTRRRSVRYRRRR